MNDLPLISVITISYNEVATIEQTILSIINQTYPNIEYIIIDGGSKDGTVDIINKYANKIDYWVSEPDKGIYNAMNKGINNARGKYLNFMNAGDCFYSEQSLANVFNEIDYDIDYIAGIAIYSNGSLWRPVKSNFSFVDIFKGGVANHQASFIKRDLFDRGKYDESLQIISDEKFFFERILMEGGTYLALDCIISKCDVTGISNQPNVGEIVKKERKRIFSLNIPQRILVDYERMTRENMFVKISKRIVRAMARIINYFIYIKCSYKALLL